MKKSYTINKNTINVKQQIGKYTSIYNQKRVNFPITSSLAFKLKEEQLHSKMRKGCI